MTKYSRDQTSHIRNRLANAPPLQRQKFLFLAYSAKEILRKVLKEKFRKAK